MGLDPNVIGENHYNVARGVQKILQDHKSLQDIIAILGMDELSERQAHRRPCPQDPTFPLAALPSRRNFHWTRQKLVPIAETIKGFQSILHGEYDHLPEAAFYMVGPIEEVVAKAEKLAESTA